MNPKSYRDYDYFKEFIKSLKLSRLELDELSKAAKELAGEKYKYWEPLGLTIRKKWEK